MSAPVPTTTAKGLASNAAASKARNKWLRHLLKVSAALVLLVVLALLFWSRNALWNRYVRYPRQLAAWETLRQQRHTPPPTTPYKEFRGVLHSHSELSHDCEVPFDHILEVMESANIDFICMSDHADHGRADFSVQWRGIHGGRLFIPGFELKEGIMPFGCRSDVVVSNQMDSKTLVQTIKETGGLLFYAHVEEPRVWDRPELNGMEIYNIHSDFKRRGGSFLPLLPNIVLNNGRFGEQVLREVFIRPTDSLHRWDTLNQTHPITGIAGNDCHQNVGFRIFYTKEGKLLIEDTSPDTLADFKLNWFTRMVAKACFGPLEPGRKLFHFQLDPYERSARFVNTHVLARELSEQAVLEALKLSRAFVGFDLIADSSGFQWAAFSDAAVAVMGESTGITPGTSLRAASPLPCRFTLVKDGHRLGSLEGRRAEWTPSGPGKYRVEAELNISGEWIPWVYTNPIQLTNTQTTHTARN